MPTINAVQFRLDDYTIDVAMESSEFSANETVEMLSIGELKYVNDVPDSSEEDSSSIASIQGDWEMTFYDIANSGNSFKDELLNITSQAFVTITLTDNNGDTYLFYRSIQPYGFNYDSIEDETTVVFRPVSGSLYNQNTTGTPTIEDIINPSGITGRFATDAVVDGSGQTGFTINIDDGAGGMPINPPVAGEVVYFAEASTNFASYLYKPYKVASTTSNSITFENEVLTAPGDGKELVIRRWDFKLDAGARYSCHGYQYFKWCLEDLLLQIPNSTYDLYDVDLLIRHNRRSTSDSTDLYKTSYSTSTPDAFVTQFFGDDTAYSLFAKMCALSGYIWGQGFSQTWLVSRLDTSSPVTLTADDVENVIQVIRRPKFTNVKSTTVGASGADVVANTSTNTETTPDGKTLEYTGVFQNLAAAVLDGAPSGNFIDLTYQSSGAMETYLTDNGADAYYAANIHRGDNRQIDVTSYQTGQEIEFTYIGILGIRPYDAIEFDTSVDNIFQGKTYRINQIIYNFEEFTCDITAYRIA